MTVDQALIFIIEHSYEEAVENGLQKTYENAMDLLAARHIIPQMKDAA